MFRNYGINTCIQKIAFLAQAFHESDKLSTAEEYPSNHKSSQSTYKGRGIIQVTGILSSDGYYNEPGPYKTYNPILKDNPKLLAEDLHYAVDSGGWYFTKYKFVPDWKDKSRDSAEMNGHRKWKREEFSKTLGKSLNDLSLLIEEDEKKYFWLQSKILNGYTVSHRYEKDPNGWNDRKNAFNKLKSWFKYDKDVCKGIKELNYNIGGEAPWVLFAKQELETYGGIRQTKSPLKEKVVEYFKVSKADWYDHTGYWCGAFVRWCFAQTKDFNYVFDSFNSVTAFNWLSSEHTTTKGTSSKRTSDVEAILEIKDIFVGAIIIFDYSHVAFVIGQSIDEKTIFYVGGNQSDKAPEDGKGQRTICIGKISKSKLNTNFRLSKPKEYQPSEEEKKLPKMNVSAYELDYSSTR